MGLHLIKMIEFRCNLNKSTEQNTSLSKTLFMGRKKKGRKTYSVCVYCSIVQLVEKYSTVHISNKNRGNSLIVSDIKHNRNKLYLLCVKSTIE